MLPWNGDLEFLLGQILIFRSNMAFMGHFGGLNIVLLLGRQDHHHSNSIRRETEILVLPWPWRVKLELRASVSRI